MLYWHILVILYTTLYYTILGQTGLPFASCHWPLSAEESSWRIHGGSLSSGGPTAGTFMNNMGMNLRWKNGTVLHGLTNLDRFGSMNM